MRGPWPSRSRSHSRVFNSADIDAKLNAITSSPLLQEQRGAIVMPVYLKSLSLENYRGIGEQQLMTKFQNFNFFIGPNNSGKSIILNFISNYIALRKGSSRSQNWEEIRGLETHGGIYGGAVQVRIGFPTGEILQKFFERHPYLDVGRFQDTIISTFNAISHEQHLWLDCSLPFIGRHFEILYNIDHLFGLNPAHIWSEIHNLIRTNGQSISSPYDNSHQDIRNNKIPDIISRIKSCMEIDNLPETQLIPAIRQIGPTGARFADFSGAGLIDQLALIQNPDHNHQQDRDLFDKINTFLQSVTDRHDARIEIPNSKAHVLVRMDGRVLPLHSLGTGIQEVVMIAAFCTIAQEQIICVEEPELHLHPLL